MKIDSHLTASVISYKGKVNVSSEELWEVISSSGNLNNCHPFCKNNTVITWAQVGAEDTIEYYNGLVLNRLITSWNEGVGYELLIGKKTYPYAVAKVLWEITVVNHQISELSITINSYPDIALKKYTKLIRGLVRDLYFLPTMSKYVKSVVKGFKFYAETGRPVEKNQFGYNRMFSTRN